MIELTTSQAVERRARWKWFLAAGVLLLCLGLLGAGATTLLELTSLLVFGPLFLISSLINLAAAFFAVKGAERLFHLAAALLEAALGFLIMAQPFVIVPKVVLIV